MQILLNGEKTLVPSETVAELVERLALSSRKIAIERNGEIVPRSHYATVVLCEGDVLEVVSLMGGG